MLPNLQLTVAATGSGLFISHLDNVLGTSLDLNVVARSFAAARQAETVILAEINRLNKLLSGYAPDSEFSRWQASAGEAMPVSEDLWTVLKSFDSWQEKTEGALNAAAEGITQLWQRAAQTGLSPTDTERAQAVADARQTHWTLDASRQTATRLTTAPLRLNTFTKSYVMDRAADAALALPGVEGLTLNIGGDLLVRGNRTETISIANPRADAENALPLTRLSIQNKAVATSGDYRRGVQVGNSWYSHIVDPRTGMPAREVISATVVHPDAVTAGALATAFNILSPHESARLAASLPGTDYLIVTKDGEQRTSPDWNSLLAPENTAPAGNPLQTAGLLSIASQKDKLWNPKQELLISFELSRFEGRSHRPFVAVWIEDENNNPVRQLALWYNKPRWLHDLRSWYSMQRSAGIDPASIASATRSAGAYTLTWDGKNDKGEYVKQGTYTIIIEAAREHGTYQIIRQEMNFNGKTKQQTLNGNVEIAAAALDYRERADIR